MTVASNYAIAIATATLSDWLKSLTPVFQPMTKPKLITLYARFFPALRASYRLLLGILIGSSRCLLLLGLVGVLTLILGFRQSFEKCSNGVVSISQTGVTSAS